MYKLHFYLMFRKITKLQSKIWDFYSTNIEASNHI